MIPADKRIERLTQVARMYYEQNMNQSEIARALGISRPLVKRAAVGGAGMRDSDDNDKQRRKRAQELLAQRRSPASACAGRRSSRTRRAPRIQLTPRRRSGSMSSAFLARTGPAAWASAEAMLGRMADYAEALPDFGGGARAASFRSSAASAPPTAATTRIDWPASSPERPDMRLNTSISRLLRLRGGAPISPRLEAYSAVQADCEHHGARAHQHLNFPLLSRPRRRIPLRQPAHRGRAVGRVLAHYYDAEGPRR